PNMDWSIPYPDSTSTYSIFHGAGQHTVTLVISTDGGQSFKWLAFMDSGSVDITNLAEPVVATGSNSVWFSWKRDNSGIQANGASVTALGTVGSFFTLPEA